mmetsp:Transcript_15053/g.34279  ORF Transcript_15053/g.34279 Transcript_15053/m.34279 type:complete len:205 (+) Transcript_15053:143-757(+)
MSIVVVDHHPCRWTMMLWTLVSCHHRRRSWLWMVWCAKSQWLDKPGRPRGVERRGSWSGAKRLGRIGTMPIRRCHRYGCFRLVCCDRSGLVLLLFEMTSIPCCCFHLLDHLPRLCCRSVSDRPSHIRTRHNLLQRQTLHHHCLVLVGDKSTNSFLKPRLLLLVVVVCHGRSVLHGLFSLLDHRCGPCRGRRRCGEPLATAPKCR